MPLILHVYTPKGNIAVVAKYLQERDLLLDHPSLPSDMNFLRTQHYYNPHNPPPGGHQRVQQGVGPAHLGRWGAVSGKSVEVQRSQVDELFKSMRDGDELPETNPRMFTEPSLPLSSIQV